MFVFFLLSILRVIELLFLKLNVIMEFLNGINLLLVFIFIVGVIVGVIVVYNNI